MNDVLTSPPRKAAQNNTSVSDENLEVGEHSPFRGDLYGPELLVELARRLASTGEIAPAEQPGPDLLHRLRRTEQILEETHARLLTAAQEQARLPSGAEWILDNYHILSESMREIITDLPRRFFEELPKLRQGPFRGLPRVYALAVELISHTDSSLDETNLTRFVSAFQSVSLLTIGELWAVPIMARLGLLENLRGLSTRVLMSWEHRKLAEAWKEHLIACKEMSHEEVDAHLLHPDRVPGCGWTDPFLIHLFQALRDHGPEAAPGLSWLSHHLENRNDELTEVVRRENQRQAADQVSIGNAVTSLRLLSMLEWAEFFEKNSAVEAELRKDPANYYARQDFATRDRYRKAIEGIARGAKRPELEIARKAIEWANGHDSESAAERAVKAHCGYYLIGPRREQLRADVKYQPTFVGRIREGIEHWAHTLYFGSVAALTGLVAVGAVAYYLYAGGQWSWVWALALVLLIPASELAIGLVHLLVTLLLPPRVLPKLDFKDGIPEEYATFVVIPTLLTSHQGAQLLLQRLEIHYLANSDTALRFALLTDFGDAPAENLLEDGALLEAIRSGIDALNQRHCAGGPDRFFLFHRKRQWNPNMNCWMGWERKRGKLTEFNRLLRGAKDTSFTLIQGNLKSGPHIHYVITLDTDTQMPRETARRMVATMAHPLNRPQFDSKLGRVTEGYGVLQPRVGLVPTSAGRTRFTRVFAGSVGLDPYTTAVSDVYQDLFGQGSFTGKGIYDVDAFEQALGKTFPDNRILSHDLIEGNYVRCGLVTDIELLDELPANYLAYARREHRWVRGDWQILSWLFPRVPGPNRTKNTNPLGLLERWKIFDNLRRSLLPPSLVVLLLLSWTVLPGSPLFWTAIVLIITCWPLCALLLQGIRSFFHMETLSLWSRSFFTTLGSTAGQLGLSLVFLANQACGLVDAIVRTLWRLIISRKNLLEWESAAATEHRLGSTFGDYVRMMGLGCLLALAIGVTLAVARLSALPVAAPFLLAWLVSPLVAYWTSKPLESRILSLTRDDRLALRGYARKTWHFFENFVTAEDHFLPPDNFQEDPRHEIAHRTSPTNMGLYLLSTLAAQDLGYISLATALHRLEQTFETFDRLERYRGHFLNWYETNTLKPLPPLYISTVDSGNCFASLLTLRQGLEEKANEPLVRPALAQGLEDVLRLARSELGGLPEASAASLRTVLDDVDKGLMRLAALDEGKERSLAEWYVRLEELAQQSRKLLAQAVELDKNPTDASGKFKRWATCLDEQVTGHRDELLSVAPWLQVLIEADSEEQLPNEASQERWSSVKASLLGGSTLNTIQTRVESVLADWSTLVNGQPVPKLWSQLREALQKSKVRDLLTRCRELAERAGAFAKAMDFRLLYNQERHLFSIGYNHALGKLDNVHYDLLASEASLTSFLMIAHGVIPKRHWFQLGRPLTEVPGGVSLVSWGGTMFEYLMPRLWIQPLPGTLLYECWQGTVARQREYGRQNHVPWGISESAYNALDSQLHYQYQAFGVPGLGLKRGLAKDLVLAPYATALALAVDAPAARQNFQALAAEGGEGTYGFYEALDYTKDRVRRKRSHAIVRTYMAHHQGMTLVAIANCLLDDIMPRRFHSLPRVRASELLLHERLSVSAPVVQPHEEEVYALPLVSETPVFLTSRLTNVQTPHPRVQLLSNARYSVALTVAGSGLSTWRDLDITRWREDRVRDDWGQFIYVRDLKSHRTWSAAYQPLRTSGNGYEVLFSADKAEFRRRDGEIETHMEVTVSPENDAEIRRLNFINHSRQPHDLEITSYAEVVLHPHAADAAHPAFAKLFLETEYIPEETALLCRRRPRSEEQKPVWALHVLAVDGDHLGEIEYETDRSQFLGRGGSPADPRAMQPDQHLSQTTGAVLDPIFSIRLRIRVPPQASLSLAFSTAVAADRHEALTLADQYHDFRGVARAFELAWAHSKVELQHLQMQAEEVHLFQRLAGHMLYAGPIMRSEQAVNDNKLGAWGLWRFGVSGDRPIVLLRVAGADDLPLVRQVIRAHAYWRLKGLIVDLVMLNEHAATYREEFHEELLNIVRSTIDQALIDKPGGVYVLRAVQIEPEELMLLQAAARVVLRGQRGSLANQLERPEAAAAKLPALQPLLRPQPGGATSRRSKNGSPTQETEQEQPESLAFWNGWGGFASEGREYVVRIQPQRGPALPPAPWINVIATPNFGFLVSESGGGYTWASNSQMNRLTPWSNDPVSDPPSEAIYLRDEETGELWSPTPLPCGDDAPTQVRHGQGYTIFQHRSKGLGQELLLMIPPSDPVKILRLRLQNLSNYRRRLAAFFYVEWVLRTSREPAAMQVRCSRDAESGALLARNVWSRDFGERVAFAASLPTPNSFTTDRAEFIGRNGTLRSPASLQYQALSGNVSALADPCAALHVRLSLDPGETRDVVFFLGQVASADEVRSLLGRYLEPERIEAVLGEVRESWDRILDTIQIRTPDTALDLLFNRWLLYQVLSCRFWGRSAFYQSGGAYGFRDQLQDVMALVHTAPQETREHILRAASRQFLEGDVQHWWHTPSGAGIRTRCSDDMLWLPLAVCHYVDTTGDRGILDERVTYLRGPELKPEQEESFGQPEIVEDGGTVYEHCQRALDFGYKLGSHGLPLMGTCDWNDGMNHVGRHGKGESVWMAWFLVKIFKDFANLAEQHQDTAHAATCRERASQLLRAAEEHAWDGQWYLRAYFDDGTPLGSTKNEECRLDSIAQSWAVMAGANPQRALQAMTAVEANLVRENDRMILLFTPPFDRGQLQPGYIKGYVPGIRENGGQYTHAATWVVLAMAELGQGTKAVHLLDLLNPIGHSSSTDLASRYRVEPYVVVADIYSAGGHVGRGGWTWYTGSASWYYRVVLETVLGFRRQGDKLQLDPCIAKNWPGFEITYRYRSATYRIKVENPQGVERGVDSIYLNGQKLDTLVIELTDDGKEHQVRAILGKPS